MRRDPALDAMIETEVAEALRPYADVYPPEVLDELRHMMRIVLRTHPTATYLFEQLLPQTVPAESGKEGVLMFKGAMARAKKAG
jgi:hypothetical protein